MKNHLKRSHPTKFVEYMNVTAKLNEEKTKQEEEMRTAEESLEKSAVALAEATGTDPQVQKRPIKVNPITSYFGKSAPIKYKANSDLQRRFDLESAIYMATANLSFQHMESKAIKR